MRNKIVQAQLNGMVFALEPSAMTSLMAFANADTPRADSRVEVANNSVAYSTVGSVAVISIDGAMHKKDIGGMCSSVASYDQMVKAIDRAEADENIKTILFRVDSPGGSVAGADEVESRIFNSKKKTITLYENVGASGAIWIFTASDEVYSTEATVLGSIGVIVSYIEEDEKEKRVTYVSKNAQNKDCSLAGNCKDKITNMINTYEEMFYARVMKNTGFDEDKIKSVFNNGDTIFAKDALKAGFIKEITTFKNLLASIGSNIVPTASISDNTIKSQTGEKMKFDRENLDATETLFNALSANKETLEMRLSTATANLEKVTADLEALQAKYENLEASASEAVEQTQAGVVTTLQEAISEGVSVSVALQMVQAETPEDASKIAVASKQSSGQTLQQQAEQESGIMAFAKKNQGSIR